MAGRAVPGWAGIDAESVYAAARTGLAELALSGCTTVFDHHYVFPRGRGGLIEAELRAARELGVRIVASRGSMDLGVSQGGLPPDSLVESIDEILADTERLAAAADGECGPDRSGALLAVLRHTGADDRVGGARATARVGAPHTSRGDCGGGRFLRRALRMSTDRIPRAARLARGGRLVRALRHLPPADIATFARHGVGVAHCPTSNLRLGAGVAPVRDLLDAGVRVGLGVDGSASNERGDLFLEVKQALLVARGRGGPRALSARDALRVGTRGGAAVLGRSDIGQLAPGLRADFAVWPTDELSLCGAVDPVAGLVLAGPHRVDRLVVGGDEVVRDGRLTRADEGEIARAHLVQSRRFAP